MDLHPLPDPPTDDERDAIARVLGASAAGGPAAPLRDADEGPAGLAEAESLRHLLLPVLHALQARVGWISPGGLGEACRRLSIPPAEAYGVATFYALFSTKPRPPAVVHVCEDVVCKARGADALCDAVEARRGPAGTARDGTTWLRSPCLGLCEQAPAAMLTVASVGVRADAATTASAGAHGSATGTVPAPIERAWGHATADQIDAALATQRTPDAAPALPQQPREGLRLLRRVGAVDPTSLGAYRASGGYEALRRALAIGANAVIREVTESRLMGRGGAAFPTGRKWAAVAAQPARPHWLVCNADESEPGTFKDRVLMEGDPFRLVEAMTIAGIATGCARGIVYLRGEYPLAIERVQHAIDEARRHGFLGADILGRGVAFELEIRKGAGAYICGEETALFNSIEGLRGEPRSKPPFPVEVGLFGKPTLINNVETLCNVPDIVLEGGAAFARIGTAQSTGTRLFCLSGQVARPGIYEVPFGTTLRALLELAGGVASPSDASWGGGLGPPPATPPAAPARLDGLQAILLGGAAGTFVGPEALDVPLSFEDTRKVGATLGSGVVVVFDTTTPLMPILQRVAAFFRDESCGQCVPCRIGTVRQEELLARVARGRPQGGVAAEQALYGELSACMRDASICGLGQTASSAVESALARFPQLWGAP